MHFCTISETTFLVSKVLARRLFSILWMSIFGRTTRKIQLISYNLIGKHAPWMASFQCLAKILLVGGPWKLNVFLEKFLKNGCSFLNELWTSPEIPYCWLVTTLYPDLGRASDWLCCKGKLLQLIRSSTQIRVVTHHQYAISALIPLLSFCRETSGDVSKC